MNLGVHLVRDAFMGEFDQAAVLTNDTDLAEAFRVVTQEVGMPLILLTPVNDPAASLVRYATDVRHVRPYLGPCHFPDCVVNARGRQIQKPSAW